MCWELMICSGKFKRIELSRTFSATMCDAMIEPVEVDNLQITVSQGIKTSAPHDSSCDGCYWLFHQ